MLAGSALAAETQPRRAQAYRADLTRVAHSTWGLDAPIPVFAAQLHQESSWDVSAVSPVGAIGMAQFMPATAQWWCNLNSLSAADCQPRNPVWAMRSLVGYDLWLLQRVGGASEYDRMWASLRSYNGGLGHWQNEARLVRPLVDHASVDRACGRASRAAVHCTENLAYPDRILRRLQRLYASWGRSVVPA
jgi:soluble lytic murein transglycosylase-like protein